MVNHGKETEWVVELVLGNSMSCSYIGCSLYMNLGDALKIFEVIIGPKEEMSNC